MHYSNRIFNKIRVAVLKVITAVMAVILIVCMDTYDGDLRVWIPLFLISFGWIFLILIANGYLTCGDCKYKNICMERSRDYPCKDFKKRGRDETADNDSGVNGDRDPDGGYVRMPGSSIQQVQ